MLPGLICGLVALAGCSAMDEFSWRKMNFEVFRDPEDPMKVIQESKDGSARARALRCLREPLANGGTKEEQDAVVADDDHRVADHGIAHRVRALTDVNARRQFAPFEIE